ncbi:MAG: cysteine desulfurase [Phenylobacterium sp.]|jgi:cysteine desulfurase/selenocysteine lyase|uniref:aminotransferase class V-fold PLP-dependent enzyme n=1 Tax=Phenylobacterium sp. TaxID=1871053 RepID=UPI00260101FD|nr:cysteine desulfurase [Phenylobacterium sp.]MCA3710400.1 cysteine desulfurase [Phenylobacterium sp.]MCA3738974.1 cysteine desulfurase [Phenylobacterium sp.]MCA3756371.1 cysteine desulfurase [Phenylobacterium sp.]MCA4916040.1 cysteine desulfurase [Phenylobacterium sp.]MCA6246343.1 cysteine desulfurase [Phenylobacterium sp.]
MGFDPERVRGEFPILSRRIGDRPLVYLDSAASAQKPEAVIQAMTDLMRHSYANVHRGLHTLANETTELYENARKKIGAFIGAPETEIVFTRGATEALNLVAAGLGRDLSEGDEVVLTEMEHHANIVPWHFLREQKGVVLRFAPLLPDGALDMEALEGLISPRTRVVSVVHMSNVLGTVNPIRRIAALARAAGAVIVVDACQSVVHARLDVRDLDADFVAFSGHKLYGPTGIGVLWGRADRLAALPPWQGGGEMIDRVDFDRITYAEPPLRFEAGTPPIVEAVGLGAAVDWLSSLDRDAIHAHEAALYERAREGVASINGLRILGEAEGKGAVLSFTLEGAHAHDIAQLLDRYGVAVRAGTHCAEPLMRRLGVSSSVRASFALYNTAQEVDAFLEALDRTRTFFL